MLKENISGTVILGSKRDSGYQSIFTYSNFNYSSNNYEFTRKVDLL